jgi:hypothetical protein
MKKTIMSLLAVSLAIAAVIAASGASARVTSPPTGLTAYGRIVWNLDALLRDTFGQRPVYLNAKQSYPKSPRNFSTKFTGDCCSATYIYTFANAHHSTLRTVGPTKPPRPNIGASGYEVPLTIRGAYIYCGHKNWLFEHGGNGPANWLISCHR